MSVTAPRHAVVTGASSGIGLAICLRLLRESWRVTGLSRSAPDIADSGFAHRAVDLLDHDAVTQGVADISADGLVHAAGHLEKPWPRCGAI